MMHVVQAAFSAVSKIISLEDQVRKLIRDNEILQAEVLRLKKKRKKSISAPVLANQAATAGPLLK